MLPSSYGYYVMYSDIKFLQCSDDLLAKINVKSCAVSLKTLGKVAVAAIHSYESQESKLHTIFSAIGMGHMRLKNVFLLPFVDTEINANLNFTY
jgi:hypothetical protein